MTVTQREITSAIGSMGLHTLEQVGKHTRAGTGCGTWHSEIRALLLHASGRNRVDAPSQDEERAAAAA